MYRLLLFFIIVICLSHWSFGQSIIKHFDFVDFESGTIFSFLANQGVTDDEILTHTGEFAGFSGSVIRPQSGRRDLLAYAYGIIEVDLSLTVPTIVPSFHTQNFTAEIQNSGGNISYIISFDSNIDTNFFTFLVTPRDSDDATQAAAFPLAGPDKNKIQVFIYDKLGNQAPGKHAFSLLVFRT